MEQGRFKQRIVGGLVLVALGAIVIPFLLDMHQESEWWGNGNIPQKPDNGFITRVLPLEEWSRQAESELKEGSAQLNAQAPVRPTEQQPAQPAPKQKTIAPSPAAPAVSAVKAGWVVQLASFSNAKSAEELRDQLRQKGYRAFVERLDQGGQAVFRVRIGPEAQRASAEAIQTRLERELKLKTMVMSYP